jgi:GNAT superfamily N-acetyltransferase
VTPVLDLRQIGPDEWRVLHALAFAAFTDLERRLGDPPIEPPPDDVVELRFRHVIESDPGGAWLAEEDGRPVGAALAILRDGLWGLSMLVVHPDAQSGGVGRALLERTLRYGAGARGGIIASSGDARALRAYARAGFALHPAVQAGGVPRRLDVPPGVREGSLADLGLTEAVDRAVRGAAHGPDIEALLANSRMLVVEGRGYALAREDHLALLAATDETAARDLLRAVIATAPEGESIRVEYLTAAQGWAVDVVLEAGLALEVHNALFLRGDVGPFHPYLPSGAYL